MKTSAWHSSHCELLLQEMPCGVMVMDRNMRIVDHNRAFAEVYGESVGKLCFHVYKDRGTPCPECVARETFADGQRRVLEESGTDRKGQTIYYLAHLTPLCDADGEVTHVAAITTDMTATKRLQREYQTLFEKVPCYVTVLNRDRRVVKANEMFRRTFGEPRGEHCYKLFKQRRSECEDCPAAKTFDDGESHTSRHVGKSQDGTPTHYVVSTAPLLRGDGKITHVIEMCLDVTETQALEAELLHANMLREALVDSSLDSIVVLDEKKRIVLMNEAAHRLWGIAADSAIGRRVQPKMIPTPLSRLLKGEEDSVLIHETRISNTDGEEIPVRLAGMTLRENGQVLGVAVFVQDLREIKQLEKEKLVAERLAAVGQTVASLSHGIKNIMTGLEGGMYVTSTGLKKGDYKRIQRGWGMLERNMHRISTLARDLLSFSRGDAPKPKLVDPAGIVREVAALYENLAAQNEVTLKVDIQEGIAPASFDAGGLHDCLTNLLSNAFDACLLVQEGERKITMRLLEEASVLAFEVADSGCGMDNEVKKKAFTSFFTTKGSGGTGLGLLTTRKIVQQHGGEISFNSVPDRGTTFRLSFPRKRLPEPEPGSD